MTIDIDEKYNTKREMNVLYDPNKNNINDVIKAIDVLREANWLQSHDKEIMDDGERAAIEKIITSIFGDKYKVIRNSEK